MVTWRCLRWDKLRIVPPLNLTFMKRITYFLFLLVFCTGFVSCSSSDDKDTVPSSYSVSDLQGDWLYDPGNGNLYACTFNNNHIDYFCFDAQSLKSFINIEGDYVINGNTLEVTITGNHCVYGATYYKKGDTLTIRLEWLNSDKTKLMIDNFSMTKRK